MRCEHCGITDDEVLIKHHIDNVHTIILCGNCHLKVHKKNFRVTKVRNVDLKSSIFNYQRLTNELANLALRDSKVDQWLKEQGLL